jgi:release factor glutamine methyltransferase
MSIRLPKLVSDRAQVLLDAGIDQASAEIEIILCSLLKCDRLRLYLDSDKLITEEIVRRLDEIVARRATRYPLQYILEEAWFYGRCFFVSPAVMVPTPETELLCETALRFVRKQNLARPRILDLGTGSGVISVTLANELDDGTIVAVDISTDALDVARRNAHALGHEERIEFRPSDFFAALDPAERFDLILSNPPYISDNEYRDLPPEVLADPKISLTSGDEGLDAVQVILQQAPDYLAEGGRIMFEIGYNQADRVAELTSSDERYRSLVTLKDLADIDRVIMLACD